MTDASTCTFNCAAVQLHEVLRDRKAKAQSRGTTTAGAILLAKSLEHMRQKFRRDATTVILHDELEMIRRLLNPDCDATSGRREFDRVVNEIPQNLLESTCVAGQLSNTRVDGSDDLDASRIRGGPQSQNRCLQQPPELDGACVESNVARDKTIHIEQSANELSL